MWCAWLSRVDRVSLFNFNNSLTRLRWRCLACMRDAARAASTHLQHRCATNNVLVQARDRVSVPHLRKHARRVCFSIWRGVASIHSEPARVSIVHRYTVRYRRFAYRSTPWTDRSPHHREPLVCDSATCVCSRELGLSSGVQSLTGGFHVAFITDVLTACTIAVVGSELQ